MDREDSQCNLRLAEGLHQHPTAEARRSMRSLNGEIVWRLRRSLSRRVKLIGRDRAMSDSKAAS
jgi:Arc-like DNA binding domain